jgi:diaminohydroxyphosphoribosylaminopyrimidine deaminase/5-amino-6-(5-phosphoribosylamino)uracil reductase
MRRALTLARRGWGQTAPNPMVGAVVVREGRVVGEGYHRRYGEPHAEVDALAVAGPKARGATLYVTLEPCAHHGKTPPCVDAIIAAGVRRVVIATPDPNPIAAGGHERLARAGIDVVVGVEEARAREHNAIFLHTQTSRRAWVTVKLAMSIDGAIADAHGRSRWFTGSAARRATHWLRAGHDAVAVGIGTALADDPTLTVRDGPPPRVPPARIVFDRAARLPLESTLVRTARQTPTFVVARQPPAARARALRARGVTVIDAPTPGDALVELRALAIRSVLVEGGARLAGALVERALVDRLIIFHAPVLLGAGALPAFVFAAPAMLEHARRFAPVERHRFGDDLMTVYAPRESSCSPD